MDAAGLTFHRSLLRLAKGMVSAYETWLTEQTVSATVEHLKQARAERPPRSEQEKAD